MTWWQKLVGKPQVAHAPVDLSVLGCDVHSHLIPGIDDGSPTLEASLEMLRGFAALGYRKVITTPHVMADGYRNTSEVILGGLATLRAAAKKEGIPIEVEAAAEYYMDHELGALVQAHKLLTFGDRMVLFELPFIAEPHGVHALLFSMRTVGYQPVLAHPERYAYWHGNLPRYRELKERGALLQLNLLSLLGAYSPAVRRCALHLVEADLIDLVGSDCHAVGNLVGLRAVTQEPALRKLVDGGKLLNATL
jgi:protein-tyrosine phosphatase